MFASQPGWADNNDVSLGRHATPTAEVASCRSTAHCLRPAGCQPGPCHSPCCHLRSARKGAWCGPRFAYWQGARGWATSTTFSVAPMCSWARSPVSRSCSWHGLERRAFGTLTSLHSRPRTAAQAQQPPRVVSGVVETRSSVATHRAGGARLHHKLLLHLWGTSAVGVETWGCLMRCRGSNRGWPA